MSGDDLRDAAIKGYSGKLKDLIKAQANTCSRDKMSLCSLHYAAWNGHVECVKLLVCNPFGVDGNGQRASSLNFASCLGYTALHLVALDSPSYTAYEVTILLLIAGLDRAAKDLEGKTAYQIAVELDRTNVLRAFKDFDLAAATAVAAEAAAEESTAAKIQGKGTAGGAIYGDNGINRDDVLPVQSISEEEKEGLALLKAHEEIKSSLLKNYCFQVKREGSTEVSLEKAGFDIPDFLVNHNNRAHLPPGMVIYEEQIKPLLEEGFYEMGGMQSYACLHFSQHQAVVNKNRREALVLADPTRK